MIAYNKTGMDNLYTQNRLEDACRANCISVDELENCKKNFPVSFYTPNFLIRVGLFLLTVIIASFALGFFGLLVTAGGNTEAFRLLPIFFGIASYVLLEVFVKRYHYESGVDDALLWLSAVFIFVGINSLLPHISSLANALLIFVIASYLSLRFVDTAMSVVACLALLAVFFFAYIRFGDFAKATASFLIMTIAGLIYFISNKSKRQYEFRYYADCLLLIEITSLVCFYVAANYYAVRETSNAMFQLGLKEGEGIPMGWIFWILTVLIPVIYIVRGIQKHDMVLLRTGLILTAVTIFTLRHYYHILSTEGAMVLGGSVMIILAYLLIRYLKKPKHAFTSDEVSGFGQMGKLQIESLVIAEIASVQQQPVPTHTRFGGGSGGGGGAGGNF